MIEDKDWIVNRLKEVQKGKPIKASYHLQRVLEDNDYIRPVYEKKGKGRGRTSKSWVLFGRGKRIMNRIQKEAEEKKSGRVVLAATAH
jgi:predicted transcriptional regulator